MTSSPDPQRYIEATQEAGRQFYQRGVKGPVDMLNLLRFRDVADYSAHPKLAPTEPITGAEAYRLYTVHTLPFLEEAGGEVLYAGEGGPFLVGPSEVRWDLLLLVRHKSVSDFLTFASNKGYLAGIGHRTAALEDSRLLPLSEGLPVEILPIGGA